METIIKYRYLYNNVRNMNINNRGRSSKYLRVARETSN